MQAVGIVAEYNPFHNGHAFHIAEAKRMTGAEYAVAVMSGSFVQRGEPAVANKFVRAKWALQGGADMVIELPDVFALSCAERFACGSIRILRGIGIVDSICFGSECGDIDKLSRLSGIDTNTTEVADALSRGLPYPKAASSAFGEELCPNDILGVEYLRAIKRYAPSFAACCVKRVDSGYESDLISGDFASAKAVRTALSRCVAGQRICESTFELLSSVLPRYVLNDIKTQIHAGAFPASAVSLSDAILYRFRSMSADDISSLPEVSEGLENLFMRGAIYADDYANLLSKVKSKRYTMARLKRICMNALLGVTSDIQALAASSDDALYARMLGIRSSAIPVISEICRTAQIPIVIRSRDREKLPPLAQKIDRISQTAHAIRAIGQPYDKSCALDVSERLIVV